MIITAALFYQSLTVLQGEAQMAQMREIDLVQTRLESELDGCLLPLQGLAAYVKVDPEMTGDQFTAYAGDLIGTAPYIRNMALIKDTTILYVYPLAGNETIVGVDLASIPEQSADVLNARDSGQAVISGPFNLIEGGRGVIFRMPVFIRPPAGGPDAYWGQVSIVLDIDRLMSDIVAGSHSGYRIWLQSAPDGDSSGHLIWRDAALPDNGEEPDAYRSTGIVGRYFPTVYSTADMSIPGGTWELYAIGTGNILDNRPLPLFYLALGLATSLIAAFLISYLAYLKNRLHYMAYFDPLTGLPTRPLFYERFAVSSQLCQRNGYKMGLFMVDMDKFKEINDTYGHLTGDLLLKAVAQRLQSNLRDSDTLSRIGGDEFVVICPFVDSGDSNDTIIRRLTEAMGESFLIGESEYMASFSIGGAMFPDDGINLDDLIYRADEAMYMHKKGKQVP